VANPEEGGRDTELVAKPSAISHYDPVEHSPSLGWAFLAVGVPVLVVALLLAETRAKDAWVLQGVVPAFILFGVLLAISLMVGQPELALLNAAIALGLLAIIPSVKYGFVYGEFDAIGHYSAALQIARTGSLTARSFYSEQYAGTPLLHIFLAMTSLTSALPVEIAIACTLFLEHFLILVLVVQSTRKLFPNMNRRLVVFFALITLPVISSMTGTVFGLLMLAMLTYVLSMGLAHQPKMRYVVLTTILMISLILSHMVTVTYFLAVIAAYAVSSYVIRAFPSLGIRSSSDHIVDLVPRFIILFLFWLAYVGENLVYTIQGITSELFLGLPISLAAQQLPFTEVIYTFLLSQSRLVFSVLAAVVASSIALVRRPRAALFRLYWWSLAVSVLMGGVIVLGYDTNNAYRFLAYASLTAPFFLCYVISGRKISGPKSPTRMRIIKVVLFATLIVSMVATHPLTPLYPTAHGAPILDDNDVNSIYAISGLEYFSSVYSSERVITSHRIFTQLESLHPELMSQAYSTIFPDLEYATSPTELKKELVIFDSGGKSGTATLAMRVLTSNMTREIGVVYSNGFFYVGLAS